MISHFAAPNQFDTPVRLSTEYLLAVCALKVKGLLLANPFILRIPLTLNCFEFLERVVKIAQAVSRNLNLSDYASCNLYLALCFGVGV